MNEVLQKDVDEFLACKKLAFVGLSRDPKGFSHHVYKEMKKRGYELFPVNPGADEITGDKCYRSVKDIEGDLDGAFLITPPMSTDAVVRECKEKGISQIWMQAGVGLGAGTESAVEFCAENDISCIYGNCILMFLPPVKLPHNIHSFFKRLFGSYPR